MKKILAAALIAATLLTANTAAAYDNQCGKAPEFKQGLPAIMESLQMAAKGQISLTALPGFILADCGQYDLAGKWDLITGLTGDDESED